MDRRIRALVVGAVSRDLPPRDTTGQPARPGGVVHHAGLALAGLGAEVRILTRARLPEAEALLGPLRAAGASVRCGPSRETTAYRNDYRGARDHHELIAASDPIRGEDLPEDWRSVDLVQLGPLHSGDIHPDLPARLRGFIGLDVQGFFREPEDRRQELLPAFLPGLDVLQASEDDLEALLGGETPERFLERWRLKEMIVTRGARGATVLCPAGGHEIPVHPRSGADRAGLGDVFLATYLLARVNGETPADAGRSATRTCTARLECGGVR